MNYLYYPGCSLAGTAREYDISTRVLMTAMDAALTEIEDWVCCGATAAEPVSRLLSLSLPAINLAIAEKTGQDVMIPCSACYLNMKKVVETIKKDAVIHQKINTVLAEKNLHLKGKVKVRHLLDVLSKDFSPEDFRRKVTHNLDGLTIAPYYGCQCLRPYSEFDDPERPRSMEPLIEAVGAKVHAWNMAAKCCGASNMNTKMAVAMELVYQILKDARGADAIVTVCPMCQINLEGYQKEISMFKKEDVSISVLYLPQLLGLAMGFTEKEIGVNLNLAVSKKFKNKLRNAA